MTPLAPVHSLVEHPWTWLVGTLFGFLVLGGLWPLWSDALLEWRDEKFPVIADWVVTQAVVEGDDVVLSGMMRKRRECLLVPPVIARDKAGSPHQLLTGIWAAKDASARSIPWGPWRVVSGAHHELAFTMVYVCSGSRPNIVAVGSYLPPSIAR